MFISNATRLAGNTPEPPQPSILAGCERWYAVHTLPFAEARAEHQLRRQKFQTFQPKRHRTIRHARKLRTVEAPFFPRYLFIVLDLDRHQWRSVNGTFGVSRLVMCGDHPRPVPRGVVEALIEATNARGILQLGRELQQGGSIRLLAGPFADQLGTLDRLDDTGRVQVLLHILGRQVTISTEMNNVLPVL